MSADSKHLSALSAELHTTLSDVARDSPTFSDVFRGDSPSEVNKKVKKLTDKCDRLFADSETADLVIKRLTEDIDELRQKNEGLATARAEEECIPPCLTELEFEAILSTRGGLQKTRQIFSNVRERTDLTLTFVNELWERWCDGAELREEIQELKKKIAVLEEAGAEKRSLLQNLRHSKSFGESQALRQLVDTQEETIGRLEAKVAACLEDERLFGIKSVNEILRVRLECENSVLRSRQEALCEQRARLHTEDYLAASVDPRNPKSGFAVGVTSLSEHMEQLAGFQAAGTSDGLSAPKSDLGYMKVKQMRERYTSVCEECESTVAEVHNLGFAQMDIDDLRAREPLGIPRRNIINLQGNIKETRKEISQASLEFESLNRKEKALTAELCSHARKFGSQVAQLKATSIDLQGKETALRASLDPEPLVEEEGEGQKGAFRTAVVNLPSRPVFEDAYDDDELAGATL